MDLHEHGLKVAVSVVGTAHSFAECYHLVSILPDVMLRLGCSPMLSLAFVAFDGQAHDDVRSVLA